MHSDRLEQKSIVYTLTAGAFGETWLTPHVFRLTLRQGHGSLTMVGMCCGTAVENAVKKTMVFQFAMFARSERSKPQIG